MIRLRWLICAFVVRIWDKQVFSCRGSYHNHFHGHMDRVKRIWYLSPMRAEKVQASLRIRAVSPEPSLLAHTSSESRGTFRQKTRSLAPLNGWTCAVEIYNDGMLEDTNSLDGAHIQNHVHEEETLSLKYDSILLTMRVKPVVSLHKMAVIINCFPERDFLI